MIRPETTSTGEVVGWFIFRSAKLPSDPCGASLGGYTFTLICLVPCDRTCGCKHWDVWGEGFIFRLANLPSDPRGASLDENTLTLIFAARRADA